MKKTELDLSSVSRRVSEINLYYLFEEPLTQIVVFIYFLNRFQLRIYTEILSPIMNIRE